MTVRERVLRREAGQPRSENGADSALFDYCATATVFALMSEYTVAVRPIAVAASCPLAYAKRTFLVVCPLVVNACSTASARRATFFFC
jgi:hypothetical protein